MSEVSSEASVITIARWQWMFCACGPTLPSLAKLDTTNFSFCCSEWNMQSGITQTKNTEEVTKKFSMKNSIFFHALHMKHVQPSLTSLFNTLGLIKGISLQYKADPPSFIIGIYNGTCRTLSSHTQIWIATVSSNLQRRRLPTNNDRRMTAPGLQFQKSSPRPSILMAHSIFSFPHCPLARKASMLGVLGRLKSGPLETLSPPCMRDFTLHVLIAVLDIVITFKGIQQGW